MRQNSLARGLLLCWLLFCTPAFAQPDSLGVVRVIYSGRVFTHINANDVQAAIKLWEREVMRALDIELQLKISFFNSPADIRLAIEKKRFDLISLDAMEYLQFHRALDPVLISDRAGGPTGRYLLLVRSDSQLSELADLANKHLMAETGRGEESVSTLWLDVELLRAKLYALEHPFFSQIEPVDKTMAAVLPVLLGQASAALVYEPNFVTLSELNPQLKRELVPLMASAPLLPNITCVPRDADEWRRQKLIDISMNLANTPRGAQIVAFFGVEKVLHYQPGLLDHVTALAAERDSLLAHLKAKKGAP